MEKSLCFEVLRRFQVKPFVEVSFLEESLDLDQEGRQRYQLEDRRKPGPVKSTERNGKLEGVAGG